MKRKTEDTLEIKETYTCMYILMFTFFEFDFSGVVESLFSFGVLSDGFGVAER